MSTFDPDQFLDMPIEGANDTKIIPVPVGEYQAVADSAKVVPWQSRDGSSSGIRLDVLWEIDDENVRAITGRERVTCKQGIMLDLNDAGQLDMGKGKNVNLGRLREALNMNQPDTPFSFSRIPGNVAKVAIKHRVVDDEIYAEVKGAARIS